MSNRKDRISNSIVNNDTEEQKNQSPIVESPEDKEMENPNVDEKESIDTETPNNDEVEIPNPEEDSKEDSLDENSGVDDEEIENDLEESDSEEETEIEESNKVYYVVIHEFRDLEDKTPECPNGYIYRVNNPYPRDGFTVDEKRIQELMSTNNKIGKVLIKIKK